MYRPLVGFEGPQGHLLLLLLLLRLPLRLLLLRLLILMPPYLLRLLLRHVKRLSPVIAWCRAYFDPSSPDNGIVY